MGVPGKKVKSDDDHKIYYDDKNIYSLIESYSFKRIKVLRMLIPLKILENYLNIFVIIIFLKNLMTNSLIVSAFAIFCFYLSSYWF